MKMNKIAKEILQGIIAVVIICGSLAGVVGVKSCKESFAAKSRESSNLEKFNEIAKQLDSLCPIMIDGWTTMQSIKVENKEIIVKCSIDEDVIGALGDDSYKCSLISFFYDNIHDVKKMGRDMLKSKLYIKLEVLHSNGDVENTIAIDGSDFIYPPRGIELDKKRVKELEMDRINGMIKNDFY